MKATAYGEPPTGIRSTPLLDGTQERVLIARYQHEGDQEALRLLITSNIRLVASIASPYARLYQVDCDDLVQEGLMGLLRAIEKFNLAKPYKLSTYATPSIERMVVRALTRYGHVVYLPDRAQQALRKVKRHLSTQEASSASVEELATHIGESGETVEALLRWSRPALSMDAPLFPDDPTPLADFVGARDEDVLSDACDRDAQCTTVAALLAALSDERKRVIIRWCYGLGCDKLTLQAIGERLGITKERVRQIRNDALKELRAAAAERST